MASAKARLIELARPRMTEEVFIRFLEILEEVDTEAKREILKFQRDLNS